MHDSNDYKTELESLSGKVFNGDITPIVFDLLKDSKHIDKLIEHLRKGDKKHVNNNKPNNTVRKKDYDRPCFEKWFSNAERL